MNGGSVRGRALLSRALACSFLLASSCVQADHSVLKPKGPAARVVTRLWWPMFWVSVVVFVFVVAMGTWGVLQGRHRNESDIAKTVPWGERFILISGLGVTTVILLTFFIFSLRGMATLARAQPAGLDITVVAHDWWWEVRYPNGAVTANEIHIPAGQRVHVALRSDDVIHSFWVPELAPKIDLIPGRNNEVWMQADHPGEYRGQCAEYCGLQHAHMIFFVIADPPAQFDSWVAQMAEPENTPTSALAQQGQSVFLQSTCIGCHAIKGTTATATLGPDLTHVATRQTIAAGTIPLTASTLRQWILDPQQIKPGVTMPPTALTADQIQALVTYLLGLGFSGR